MPRRPRVVIPGVAHHITQRGNNRAPVFTSDRDRTRYLHLLARQCAAHQLRILGYCLMTNHVHLVAVPEHPASLAHALGRAHSEYAITSNKVENRSGHLWQGRFFSCPLDESHLRTALHYVDLNPVRAQLVSAANDWLWSSARAHTDPSVHDSVLDFHWSEYLPGWNHAEWSKMLQEEESGLTSEWLELRRCTVTGAPLGAEEFVSRMEMEQGRRLQVFKAGRPRKRREKGDRRHLIHATSPPPSALL